MKLEKVIAVRTSKTIYRDGKYAIKVFDEGYSKADILNEALNIARVEETGLSIPGVEEVTKIDGKWAIVTDYAEGKTIAQLMAEDPDKKDEYLERFVDIQLEMHAKSAPMLNKLKDKMKRKISQTGLDATTRYELDSRLESMPKHNKLCHGDYCPDNILVETDDTGKITAITAVDWVHATQGNASADVANTYLMLKLVDESFAEKYLVDFCKKTHTDRRYVHSWLPIVAAARMTKHIPEEKELLESMIDVCDYQ